VVLFGGTGDCSIPGGGTNDTCNDAWVWNGTNWAQCSEGPGQACEIKPPVRGSPAMAFHANRNTMIAAGGKGDPMLLDDTWEWRGFSLGWNDITGTVGTFGDRTGHRVAYDPVKKAIVLFGGCIGDCSTGLGEESPGTTDTVVNDTWSLDGGTWLQRTVPSPPSIRCCTRMAFFDAGFNHVVVFQGQDQDNPWGIPGVWYWKWQGGGGGQWIACTGTNEACT
jgi:hypothetical protein